MPEFIDIPAGWQTIFGPDSRHACLAHVEIRWADVRPSSLINAMKGPGPLDV